MIHTIILLIVEHHPELQFALWILLEKLIDSYIHQKEIMQTLLKYIIYLIQYNKKNN